MKLRGRDQAPRADAKRTVIYTRKSTTAGLDQKFTSLDAQRETCEEYVRRQPGWVLSETRYDDGGFTGANTDRPAFQRLLADVEAGLIDVVVVYKIDRLSRSLLDFAQLMHRFEELGVALVIVTQNFSTADAMGRLVLNMLMSFAEFEREMIGERTRDKIAASRRRGMWTGGSVPFGYTNEDKKLVVNELEAVLVREIFALYGEHRSALGVARALNGRGTTKQRLARSGQRRESRAWTNNDVLRILKHPIYAGYTVLNGELCEGVHTPLVDRALFRQTQALIAAATQRRGPGGGRNPDYLLTGLLRCANCGAAFTPASTTSASGITVHRYYRCVKRTKEGKKACPSLPLPARAIEDHVIERLREVATTGTLAADVAERVKARARARRQDISIECRRLPLLIETTSAEARQLTTTIASATGGARRPLEERLNELGQEAERHTARLAEAERELANLDAIEVEADWVARCLADFDTIWDALIPANRVRLLQALVQCVDVDQAHNQVSVVLADLAAEVPDATTTDDNARGEHAS